MADIGVNPVPKVGIPGAAGVRGSRVKGIYRLMDSQVSKGITWRVRCSHQAARHLLAAAGQIGGGRAGQIRDDLHVEAGGDSGRASRGVDAGDLVADGGRLCSQGAGGEGARALELAWQAVWWAGLSVGPAKIAIVPACLRRGSGEVGLALVRWKKCVARVA